MKQDIQRSAKYSGIKYVDIDDEIYLPTDYEIDRIPNKGDVMCFNHIIGNDSKYYHWEVLYVYDKRTFLTKPNIEDCEHFGISIFVVMKRIYPEKLGNDAWKSILKEISK
jgi:hypothetical protein